MRVFFGCLSLFVGVGSLVWAFLPTVAVGQLRQADSLRALLQQPAPPERRALLLIQLGNQLMLTDPVASLQAAQEGFALVQAHPSPVLKIKGEVVLAKALLANGNTVEALEHALEAQHLANQDRVPEEALAAATLGAVYLYLQERDSSLVYFRRSIVLNQKLGDSLAIAKAYNNIGAIFSKMPKLDSALIYYQKANAISLRLTGREQPILQNNIGEIWLEKGRVAAAMAAFQASLAGKKAENNRMLQAKTYRNIAECLLRMGQPASAIRMADSALALSREFGQQAEALIILRTLAEADMQLGNAPRAYEHLRESIRLADSLDNTRTKEAMARAEVKHHLALKDRLNRLLNKELAIERERQRINYWWLALACMVALAGIGMSYALWRLNRVRHAHAARVADLNLLLEQRVEDRTLSLAKRNQQLAHYLHLNSHTLRGKLATLLGLAELIEAGHTTDSRGRPLIPHVLDAAREMDLIVHQINEAANTCEEDSEMQHPATQDAPPDASI